MRKLLYMGVIAAAAICLLPERSQAQGLGFGYGYGQRTAPYGFLGRLATHHMMWIHNDGPLYNYGPYNTPGHVTMHIPKPYHGAYVPGDYTLWNSGAGGYGAGQGGYGGGQGGGYPAYPGYGQPMAPQGGPPLLPIPGGVGGVGAPRPIVATAPPGDVIPAAVAPAMTARPQPAPTFAPIYPSWLTGR